MNLDALIRNQNRQWYDPSFRPPETNWYKRPLYHELLDSLKLGLIITLTGLRRVGKSTLIKQILDELLKEHRAEHLFYFSFDESVVKNESDTLRQILETYATAVLNQPFGKTQQKIFIFLDEVQIIPYWQDIIKTYFDLNPNVQFIISGSSSLFVSQKSKESLAGRLKEIIVPPLSFTEYRQLDKKIQSGIADLGWEKYAHFFPEYATAYFEKYLKIGQFPQPIKSDYSESQTRDYLHTIETKIIEYDLPRIFPVKRPDIARLIFAHLKSASGSLLSYDNLTNDLGVEVRTTIKYIDWLKQAFLLDACFNLTKKVIKSSRTSKKIYLSSTNFLENVSQGSAVETYIFNFLKNCGFNVEFFRFQEQEVDFVITAKNGQKIPWEVKYQEKIRSEDEKHLKTFMEKHTTPYAFLVTKNSEVQKKIGNTLLYHIPAAKVESTQTALFKKLN